MSREEAKKFLARNPRIQAYLQLRGQEIYNYEILYEFSLAENEHDACVNLVEVARAIGYEELLALREPNGQIYLY
jgi:hypothetical protein